MQTDKVTDRHVSRVIRGMPATDGAGVNRQYVRLAVLRALHGTGKYGGARHATARFNFQFRALELQANAVGPSPDSPVGFEQCLPTRDR